MGRLGPALDVDGTKPEKRLRQSKYSLRTWSRRKAARILIWDLLDLQEPGISLDGRSPGEVRMRLLQARGLNTMLHAFSTRDDVS